MSLSERDMMRRLDRLEAFTARIPVRPMSPVKRLRAVVVGSSNSEFFSTTSFFGVKRPASPVTEVPIAVPLGFLTAYPDGICYAAEIDTGAALWIGIYLQDTVPVLAQLAQRLPAGLPILVRDAVSLPITGGGGARALVYLPYAF